MMSSDEVKAFEARRKELEQRAVAAFHEVVAGDEMWRTLTDLTALVCGKLSVPMYDADGDYDLLGDYGDVRMALSGDAVSSKTIEWAMYVRLDPDAGWDEAPEATADDDTWGFSASEVPVFNKMIALLSDGGWHDMDAALVDADEDLSAVLIEMVEEMSPGTFQTEERMRKRRVAGGHWTRPIRDAAMRLAPDVVRRVLEDGEWHHDWEIHMFLEAAVMREVSWDALDHEAAEGEGERRVKLGRHEDFDDYQQYVVWEAVHEELEQFLVSDEGRWVDGHLHTEFNQETRWCKASGAAICGHRHRVRS